MLKQLIGAFGTCVCSTVRERFPSCAKFPPGENQSKAVRNLKKKSYVNSILELSLVEKENHEVEYTYWKRHLGVYIRYYFELKKLTVIVCYAKLDSTDALLHDFYTNIQYCEETQNERVHTSIIGKEFEAFECLFKVTNVNNEDVDCRVTESDNLQYSDETIHTFNIEFVRLKIKEYLE